MDEPTPEERRNAIPANRTDRRMLPGRGGVSDDVPDLMEIERRIYVCDTELGDLVTRYADLAADAAEAKANWEAHAARIAVAEADSGEKTAADVRLARAKLAVSADGIPGEDLYRTLLIMEAARDSCGKALNAVQSRLSAQQSLYRGMRAATGLPI